MLKKVSTNTTKYHQRVCVKSSDYAYELISQSGNELNQLLTKYI